MLGSLGWQELIILVLLFSPPLGLIVALTTSGRAYPDSFVTRELHASGLATATPARRMGGYLLDGLIAWLTLGIGWLIWLAIVAPRGQTPGKALVSTYVVRRDGSRAGGWFIWGREILNKGLLFGLISLLTLYVGFVISALWCLWDKDKQCLWDKVGGTYVAYAPGGPTPQASPSTLSVTEELRSLKALREDELITAEEYEERRSRLVERL